VQHCTYPETRVGGPDLPLGLASGAWTSITSGTRWASTCTFSGSWR